MSRLFTSLCAATAFGASLAPSFAAESSLTQEVHELRRDLQMQSKKIEALTQKIADLGALIKQREEARPSPEPAPSVAPPSAAAPATTATKVAKPAATPAPEAPKAEPVAPTIPHVVAKGETLTGIAKQHNVPLHDLLKLNKNTNDRKLQIGQTLKVPAVKPDEPKPAEPPAEKPLTP